LARAQVRKILDKASFHSNGLLVADRAVIFDAEFN